MLAIIYMEFAFHIGLKAEPINFPGNFLLSVQVLDGDLPAADDDEGNYDK